MAFLIIWRQHSTSRGMQPFDIHAQHPQFLRVNSDTLHQTKNITRNIIRVYHSSEWELLWLENIHLWQENGICEALQQQKTQIRLFMNSTCCARTDTNWCMIDDSVHRFWYNTVSTHIQVEKPSEIIYVLPIQRISPEDKKIWSWFEVTNTATGSTSYEFIEPLVSHLRHPLAKCRFAEKTDLLIVDRSYILPGFDRSHTSFLFDAGASSWNAGAGGPSLSYFASVWNRYGVHWDHIEAWEGKTSASDFYKTVPTEWKARTTYHHEWISTHPRQTPFIPSIIELKTQEDAYVVFKLDIDSKHVETAIVEYMLAWEHLHLIDEFVWEHHVNNYLMAPDWKFSQDMNKSISDSYMYFLSLRRKGVRAHSWV